MAKQYILFIVINNIKRYKNIKKKLNALEHSRFTVIDTLGSSNALELYNNMEYTSMLWKTLGEQPNKNYNKTIMLVLENEEEAVKLMDELDELLFGESKKLGTGFMFTIPVYKSQGVRYE